MNNSELEKLILSGDAEYKNFASGISGVIILPCPKGKSIIITSIYASFGGKFVNNVANVLFNLSISSKYKKDFFNLYVKTQVDSGGNNINFELPTIETYLVHIDDITFRSSLITNFAAIDFGVLPSIANEPLPPQGYGITIPTMRSVRLDNNEFFLPQGVNNSQVPGGGTSRNELFPEISVLSSIPITNIPNESFILNIGYAILNSQFTQKRN